MASLLLRKTLRLSQLRSLHRSAAAFSVPVTFNMYQNKRKFDEVLPEVMDTLMTSPKIRNQLPEVENWVKKLLNYTMDGGKRGRGLAVPFAYQKLEDPEYFMEDKLHTARFIGWGIEMAFMYTTIGQYLDHSSGYTKTKNNLDGFTMERFNVIAAYKTGYYSFRLPLLAALLLVKNGKERDTTELSSICLEFGKLLQVENDYKDIYWNTGSSGKAGTDIQQGKLTWIVVTALERCNAEQRSIFKKYYGSKDPEHVKRIKQLYDELQIEEAYEKFKNSNYQSLEHRIRALPREGEAVFFLEIMEACRKQSY